MPVSGHRLAAGRIYRGLVGMTSKRRSGLGSYPRGLRVFWPVDGSLPPDNRLLSAIARYRPDIPRRGRRQWLLRPPALTFKPDYSIRFSRSDEEVTFGRATATHSRCASAMVLTV